MTTPLLRAAWYKKTLKNMGVFLCYIITRERIGLKITYSTACLLVDMAEIGHNFTVRVFC